MHVSGHRYKKDSPIGLAGASTRQDILVAISRLLAKKKPWQLKVTEIAALSGISQSGFYSYFSSIEQAIHDRAVQVHDLHPDLAVYLEQEWTEETALGKALDLVRVQLEFWGVHRPILRLVQALAEDGDKEYLEIKFARHTMFLSRASAMISESQKAGRISRLQDPALSAYAVFADLEMLGATYHLQAQGGFSDEQSTHTIAALLVLQLTGWVVR